MVPGHGGTAGEQPRLAGPGRHGLSVLVEHQHPFRRNERRRRCRVALAENRHAVPGALAGPAVVDEQHVRHVLEQPLLDLGAPHHSRRVDRVHARRVVRLTLRRPLLERPRDRHPERVSDHCDRADPAAIDGGHQLVGIEAVTLERDDRASAVEDHRPGVGRGGAVHQRGRGLPAIGRVPSSTSIRAHATMSSGIDSGGSANRPRVRRRASR